MIADHNGIPVFGAGRNVVIDMFGGYRESVLWYGNFLMAYSIALAVCIACDGAGGYYAPAAIVGCACGGVVAEIFRWMTEEDTGKWCAMFRRYDDMARCGEEQAKYAAGARAGRLLHAGFCKEDLKRSGLEHEASYLSTSLSKI